MISSIEETFYGRSEGNRMIKYTGGIFADTTELKKLILEHPDYPICVSVSEDANNGDYSWMYAGNVTFHIGEFLNKEHPFKQEYVYSDRDSFEEDFAEWLWEDLNARMTDECDEAELNDEAFDSILKAELEQYEPYWEKCIVIYADN